MNRPVHFTTGLGDLTSTVAPQLVAGLAVLAHVAELCANYGVKMIYSVYQAQVMPIATELMREAYLKAGKIDEFMPDESVRYLSGEQFAYASAVQGIAEREASRQHNDWTLLRARASRGHFRAVYEPFSKQIIEVDAPGLTTPNLGWFTYYKIPHPIWPFDDPK